MASRHLAAVQYHRNLLPLFHIGRASNDLDHTTSDINLADHQLIRIRMPLDLFNLPYHNLFQILIQTLVAFHLCPCKSHSIRILFGSHIQLGNICLNP